MQYNALYIQYNFLIKNYIPKKNIENNQNRSEYYNFVLIESDEYRYLLE